MDPKFALPGLAGRSVIIAGAASGIGRATALLLARSGATVVAGDVNGQLLADLAVEAEQESLSVRTAHLDVTDQATIDAAVALADAEGRLVGAVDAAGIAPQCKAVDITPQFWMRVMDVNLTGAFLLARTVARAITARSGTGSIVIVASTSALNGGSEHAAYTASKGGLIAMSKSLAREWGPLGIRVNCVSPGPVDTPLYWAQGSRVEAVHALPLARIGQPDDLAMSIGFMLTEWSSWTTGQNLNVNGGAVMY